MQQAVVEWVLLAPTVFRLSATCHVDNVAFADAFLYSKVRDGA